MIIQAIGVKHDRAVPLKSFSQSDVTPAKANGEPVRCTVVVFWTWHWHVPTLCSCDRNDTKVCAGGWLTRKVHFASERWPYDDSTWTVTEPGSSSFPSIQRFCFEFYGTEVAAFFFSLNSSGTSCSYILMEGVPWKWFLCFEKLVCRIVSLWNSFRLQNCRSTCFTIHKLMGKNGDVVGSHFLKYS